eukprot:40048_1
MEQAILYRSMIDDLSEEEFNKFHTHLFNKFEIRSFLTECIFHLMTYEGRSHSSSHKYSNQINTILSDINDLRFNNNEPHTHNALNSTINVLSLSNLSYPVIANCASYLRLKEVINLQLVNRHIYMSCKNHSFSITQLTNWKWFDKYIENNFGTKRARIQQLQRVGNAKTVRLRMKQFDVITSNGEHLENIVWKNINHLILSGHSFFGTYVETWIDRYEETVMSLPNLQQLTLKQNSIHPSTLLKLITLNPMIKYLSLANIQDTCITTDEDMDEILEKLNFIGFKGICIKDVMGMTFLKFINRLLSVQNVESYHVELGKKGDTVHNMTFMSLLESRAEDHYWRNVEELCITLVNPEPHHLNGFRITNSKSWHHSLEALENATNVCTLKRIHIGRGGMSRFGNSDWLKYSEFITHILSIHHKHIQYMFIRCDNGTALHAITQWLKNNKKRKMFCNKYVKFVFEYCTESNQQNLFEFIESLNAYVPADWSLKFDILWTKENETLRLTFEQEMNLLKTSCNVEMYEFNHHVEYIVSKMDAVFTGGYSEKWMMNCRKCSIHYYQ